MSEIQSVLMDTTQQLHLRVRAYQRPFARPLKTARGSWKVREGLLVRLEVGATGNTGYGEAAPLSDFGSESFKQARAFLQALPGCLSANDLNEQINKAPPSTAFALASARDALLHPPSLRPGVRTAALIAREDPLEPLRLGGIRRFKLKLGLAQPEAEWGLLQDLVLRLKEDEKVRLDPNRAWSEEAWAFWRPRLNGIAAKVEFVEEPFPLNRLSLPKAVEKANRSPVPLALDESLNPESLPRWIASQWPGYFVLKPSLCADPASWLPLLTPFPERVVLSTALESGIGLSAITRLAAQFTFTDHGLGIGTFFNDPFGLPQENGRVRPLSPAEQETIWNLLPGV